ncbi:MAG: oligosaccharide flippase family protein, partial [Halobacteriovoraceae bacterium]|nr:oligosaccharide flippase family protein [Halobacteriovoraceae bacterium]
MDRKKIINTFLSLSLENVFRVFLGAAAAIWLGRYLGPESYGNYSYVLSFVMIFSPFTNLGLNEIIVGRLVKARNPIPLDLGSSFYLKLFSGIFGIIVCNTVAFFLGDSNQTRLLILLYSSMFLFKSLDTIDYFYLSKNNV